MVINFFEGHFYLLSNFSAHEVIFDSVTYKTAEHAYQTAKFSDATQRKKIAAAASAFLAREFGQSDEGRTENFDKIKVMKEIMRAKLQQHADVRTMLLQTGEQQLIKNHPDDYFWGTGADGAGKNILGKIWMELRNEL